MILFNNQASVPVIVPRLPCPVRPTDSPGSPSPDSMAPFGPDLTGIETQATAQQHFSLVGRHS